MLQVQHLIEPIGEGRYLPHAIIADYARGHLDESSERANSTARKAVHIRVAAYYQQQAEAHRSPAEEHSTMGTMHMLVETIWHLCQAEQWQEAYRFIEHERVFKSLRQRGGNAILLELCLLLQPRGNWSPTFSQAGAIHRSLAWAYNALGNREQNEQALHCYTVSGDLEGQRTILDALGWSYKAMSQMKQAEAYYQRALALCQKRVDSLSEGHVLNGLGQVYDVQGQRAQAQKYFEQALALCKEAGDSRAEWRRIEARTRRNLRYLATDFGQYDESLAYFEHATCIREQSDRRGEGVTYDFSGRA